MPKETITYRKLLAVAQAELERERDRFPRFPEPAAFVTLDGVVLTLEVEYAAGVTGKIQYRFRPDGTNFNPIIETIFPSQHRSGVEMVAFANLVQDLTRIAVGLQVLSSDYVVVEG